MLQSIEFCAEPRVVLFHEVTGDARTIACRSHESQPALVCKIPGGLAVMYAERDMMIIQTARKTLFVGLPALTV